ncbi:hypothetical protein PIB30_072404 [Stylosanthes scabra]|uniref:Uncharacterized protein n=1 Tax=Stylosanthes scabra TaxID=79078 RepID=A0ABU6QP10_9FABA|nr:hypothetical protein [Stylosanthes scabra]
MPIYHNYHGDFQNSNNSSWNQIQASLKILLPTYQPIPSDNLDELSFLSYQKQKRICADFKQTCARIIATLHETHEEENSDPEIHVQIQPDQESQFQSQYDEDEDELDERRLYRGSEDRIAAVVLQRPPPEPSDPKSLAVGEGEPASSAVATETRSCRSADLMAAVTGIHSGAEDGAVTKGKVEEHAYLVLAREVTRPPPKPPNPDSHTMAFGEASTSTSTNRSERSTANNGAEGGAFAEGKRKAATMEGSVMRLETVSRKTAFMTEVGDDNMAADLTGGGHADIVDNRIGGSSVEAGSTTSVTAKGGVALRNGEARFYRVSPIVAKPPLLLAAILPWNRVKGERHTTGGLLGGTVQWRSLSLSSFGAGEREEEGFISTAETAPRALPQANGNQPAAHPWKREAAASGMWGMWGAREGITIIAALIDLGHYRLSLLFGHYPGELFGQIIIVSIQGPTKFVVILVNGLKFYQWDPGGYCIFGK